MGLGYFVYSQIRGLAADRVLDAFANGHRIVNIERQLGIFKELALQTWVLPHGALVTALSTMSAAATSGPSNRKRTATAATGKSKAPRRRTLR